ncbi:hypothetical protein VAR608DRAFT_1315 [Variovorax sp. HW608]|nr:hypothetical protein VAR608DRAFT_1315 [Variovorax sp. HW608]
MLHFDLTYDRDRTNSRGMRSPCHFRAIDDVTGIRFSVPLWDEEADLFPLFHEAVAYYERKWIRVREVHVPRRLVTLSFLEHCCRTEIKYAHHPDDECYRWVVTTTFVGVRAYRLTRRGRPTKCESQ